MAQGSKSSNRYFSKRLEEQMKKKKKKNQFANISNKAIRHSSTWKKIRPQQQWRNWMQVL